MSIIKLNNNGVKNATAFGSITGLGSMTFIKKLTASSSATLSFVDGTSGVVLDNTYKEYLFTFKNIHPSAESVFSFQADTGTNTNYNQTITSTSFRAFHREDGGESGLGYITGGDQAQATGFQMLNVSGGFDIENSANLSGTLTLFNPSSTTFVKHFISNTTHMGNGDYSHNNFVSGYFNTTAAIDEIQFKMSSGNIDAGDICLYGIA